MLKIKRHKRKLHVYGTPKERQKIRAGLKLMEKYGWNRLPPNTCVTIKALNAISQTTGPFVKGGNYCYEINIEPADLKDDVETALTIGHEFLHVRDIIKDGLAALEREDEIQVHNETKQLVQEALPKESRPSYMGRLVEEMLQQDKYIAKLKEGSP